MNKSAILTSGEVGVKIFTLLVEDYRLYSSVFSKIEFRGLQEAML
jgi:hypothetical protein